MAASRRILSTRLRESRQAMRDLYFLAFSFAFVLVMFWAWRNDSPSLTGPTKGFLRMRPAPSENDAASGPDRGSPAREIPARPPVQ